MTARKFLVQCTLLALPIAMLFALVAWVDPYSLYGTGGPIPRELKEKNRLPQDTKPEHPSR